MTGKGSKSRKDPKGKQRKMYRDNWDRIFGKGKKNTPAMGRATPNRETEEAG